MRQVIKHRDIRLLNMIRRTDPVIPRRMKAKGYDVRDIAEITGLTAKGIETL